MFRKIDLIVKKINKTVMTTYNTSRHENPPLFNSMNSSLQENSLNVVRFV